MNKGRISHRLVPSGERASGIDEIRKAVALRLGGDVSEEDQRRVEKAFLETIEDIIVHEGYLRILNFGTFRVTQFERRKFYSPDRDEYFERPNGSRTVRFRPATRLRKVVNNLD